MLQVLCRCRRDVRLRSHLVQVRVIVGHDSIERGNLLVEPVDVLLVEVEGFQLAVGLVGGARGIVDEQLYHHAPRIAVHRGRAVGKRIVQVGTRLPLLHVVALPLLQLRQAAVVRLQTCRICGNLALQGIQRAAPLFQQLLHVEILLVQVRQQFAQFALRLRVVRMVRGTAHRTRRPLLQLFAQLHDVLALAQRESRADALIRLFGRLHLPFHLRGHLPFLRQLRHLPLLQGIPVSNAHVALRNMLPEHRRAMKGRQPVAVVRRRLLQPCRVVPLVHLPVDEQFALQCVKLRLVLMLFLFRSFPLCLQLRLALLQERLLLVALHVAPCFGVEHRELVLDEVELLEHEAVNRQRLLVELLLFRFSSHLLQHFLLGRHDVLACLQGALRLRQLAVQAFQLFRGHADFARQGMSPVDGRRTELQLPLRVGRPFACHVELSRQRLQFAARALQLGGVLQLFRLRLAYVTGAHHDFLIKRLHGEQRIVARQAQLVGPQLHAAFCRLGKLRLALRHAGRGAVEADCPVELLVQACRPLLLHLARCGEQPAALLLFCQFLGFEAVVEHSLHAVLECADLGIGGCRTGIDALRHRAVDLRARQLLQQHGLVRRLCLEEIGKTVLRQDDGAGELFVVEPHSLFHPRLQLRSLHLLALRGEAGEGAFGRVVSAGALHAYTPGGFVALAGGCGKDHGAAALFLSAPQDAGGVAGLHLLGFVGHELEVLLGKALGVFKTRRFVVKGQAHGIEDGGFSRPGVAGDGKESRRAQRFFGKVYGLFAFEGGEVAKDDFFYLHVGE